MFAIESGSSGKGFPPVAGFPAKLPIPVISPSPYPLPLYGLKYKPLPFLAFNNNPEPHAGQDVAPTVLREYPSTAELGFP